MPEVERAKISTVAASIHLIKAVMGAGRFVIELMFGADYVHISRSSLLHLSINRGNCR